MLFVTRDTCLKAFTIFLQASTFLAVAAFSMSVLTGSVSSIPTHRISIFQLLIIFEFVNIWLPTIKNILILIDIATLVCFIKIIFV